MILAMIEQLDQDAVVCAILAVLLGLYYLLAWIFRGPHGA
jgi:hypothetical protein